MSARATPYEPGRDLAPGHTPTLGIDHVVVVVADLDAAMEQYAAVLGGPGTVLGSAETGYRRGVFDLGGGQRIELCQPLDPDEPGGQSQASRAFRRRLETSGEGVHNVAVLVRDVGQVKVMVQAADVRVIESRHSDTFFAHPADMCGALLQFMPPANSQEPATPAIQDRGDLRWGEQHEAGED